MKKRTVAGTLLALAVTLAMGACDDPSDGPRAGAIYGNDPGFCGSFRSCETCTPQNGCGWCYGSDGTSVCTSSPSECTTPVFEWTWNPDGCRVPARASTTSAADAGGGADPGLVGKGDAAAQDEPTASACRGPLNASASDGGDGSIPCEIEVP